MKMDFFFEQRKNNIKNEKRKKPYFLNFFLEQKKRCSFKFIVFIFIVVFSTLPEQHPNRCTYSRP
jgi:hypothetical protein